MNNRQIKTGFGICIGLYMLLVCLNNIIDYSANFQFVSKVTGMEDIFSREKNGWRSVSSPVLQHIFYLMIIAWELVITLLVAGGVSGMIKKSGADAADFRKAGKYLRTGLFLGVVLWFTLFITIGGEWFLMWQSKMWNGQLTAFLLSICFMLFLVHQNLQDE